MQIKLLYTILVVKNDFPLVTDIMVNHISAFGWGREGFYFSVLMCQHLQQPINISIFNLQPHNFPTHHNPALTMGLWKADGLNIKDYPFFELKS